MRIIGPELVAADSSRVIKLDDKGQELCTSSFPVAGTIVDPAGNIYTAGAGISAQLRNVQKTVAKVLVAETFVCSFALKVSL